MTNSREDFEIMDFFEQQSCLIDEIVFRLIERLKSSKTTNEEFVNLTNTAMKIIKFINFNK